jgi:hypothetical protein
MAYFALLDSDNTVTKISVVANAELLDGNGVEQETIGKAFLMKKRAGNWVQTSYNGTIRKNYAGIGFSYDETRDAFIPPQPYQAWVLNESSCTWEPPIAYPEDDNIYMWDSDANNWTAVE